ncbi:hypothetical protein MCUN1_001725 [Malassezia cuniculi]|uniref:Alpha-acetolactate decarboxylase n=1 Tax=Malassezia cuniculi TaxID=948313 RepID=A0AAF0EQT8_9BASI|nr:hypothetical protein MCUN1_001725 [Malassezia cuniculi]
MPVFQYSTASALMAGVAAHGITLEELVRHGRYGLGTMLGIDGEVIVTDGTAYHLCADASPRVVPPDAQLPFAMVANIDDGAHPCTWPSISSKDGLIDLLRSAERESDNRFVVFRAHGAFDYVKVRVVRGQVYPGQPLAELGDAQKVVEIENTVGQLVGFVTPSYLAGVSVAGLHVHFLSDDKQLGGHVLELKADKEITAATCSPGELSLRLPGSKEFAHANLDADKEALHKVEG